MAKRYIRLNWQNRPSTATAMSATNLNKMDKAIDDIDTDLDNLRGSIVGQFVDDASKINNAAATYDIHQRVNALNNNLANNGSNENGRWLKLPDGTMICTMAVNLGSRKVGGNGTWADPYRTAETTVTFPETFISTPEIATTPYIPINSKGKFSTITYRSTSASQITALQVICLTDDATDANAYAKIIAVGRWK